MTEKYLKGITLKVNGTTRNAIIHSPHDAS